MIDNYEYHVFISHTKLDPRVAEDIATRLKSDGLDVWFDDWIIQAGDHIQVKIDEGLEKSRRLVFFLSANAIDSVWTKYESATFRYKDPVNTQSSFIPIRLDETAVPASLRPFKYIDWVHGDKELEYQKLLAICRSPLTISGQEENAVKDDLNIKIRPSFHFSAQNEVNAIPIYPGTYWGMNRAPYFGIYLSHEAKPLFDELVKTESVLELHFKTKGALKIGTRKWLSVDADGRDFGNGKLSDLIRQKLLSIDEAKDLTGIIININKAGDAEKHEIEGIIPKAFDWYNLFTVAQRPAVILNIYLSQNPEFENYAKIIGDIAGALSVNISVIIAEKIKAFKTDSIDVLDASDTADIYDSRIRLLKKLNTQSITTDDRRQLLTRYKDFLQPKSKSDNIAYLQEYSIKSPHTLSEKDRRSIDARFLKFLREASSEELVEMTKIELIGRKYQISLRDVADRLDSQSNPDNFTIYWRLLVFNRCLTDELATEILDSGFRLRIYLGMNTSDELRRLNTDSNLQRMTEVCRIINF